MSQFADAWPDFLRSSWLKRSRSVPEPRSDAVAVIAIHGTNDSASAPDGEKWFQRGSTFSRQLTQRLSERQLSAEILPYLWSGKNSAWERERAARELAKVIAAAGRKYASVHLIGHSHGGNVANEAAVQLAWGQERNSADNCINSITTVGAPFFEIQHRRWQRLAARVFFGLMWPALAFIAAAWLLSLISFVVALFQAYANATPANLLVLLAVTVVALPCVLFGMSLARSNLARVRRARSRSNTASILAIWHPNDEAIAFLRSIESIRIEAFPPWALFRGARRNAIPFAISTALFPLLLWPPLIAFMYLQDHSQYDSFSWGALVGLEILIAVAAPVTFSLAFFAYLLIAGVGLGGGAELFFRNSLNRFISRVFSGIALGRDSDQVIGNVSPTSHTFKTEEHVLTGELADRMRSAAEAAASALLERYRWALFNVADERGASLAALAQDAMTWDSLIHTTYFDQPETAEIIADYIARRASKCADPMSGSDGHSAEH